MINANTSHYGSFLIIIEFKLLLLNENKNFPSLSRYQKPPFSKSSLRDSVIFLKNVPRNKLEEKNGLEWKRIQGAVKFLKEQLVR